MNERRLNHKQIIGLGVVMVFLGVVALTIWLRPKAQQVSPACVGPATNLSSTPPGNDVGVQDGPSAGLRRSLNATAEAMRGAGGSERAQLMGELRQALSNASPGSASVVIREFLDSGMDAPSGQGFVLAPDGSLKESPSLRLFLLDQLAQLDPEAAAQYAERILSSSTSPDEWAVSLRHYAMVRTGAEARAFLQQKFRELIHHDSWRANPSAGFLEAFDVAVHIGGTELLPDLGALLRQKDNQAVAHAAYLALDRLTIVDAAAVLDELNRHPEFMEGREATRANYFARADAADPRQKLILEAYLLDSTRSAAELQAFAGLYPSANYMVSYNLLTRAVTPDRATLLARDRAALQTVEGWLSDPRFSALRPELETIRVRLTTFVSGPAVPENK